MFGPTAQPSIADWRTGVERTFLRVRRLAFASGAVSGVVGALLWGWTGGWVITGIMGMAFIHSIGVMRYVVPVEREIALDAIVIGATVWVIGLRGIGFLLIYPLAVALLLGHRRLAWSVLGISALTNGLIYLDEVLPGSEVAAVMANPVPPIPTDAASLDVLTWMALYAVGAALLYYLWLVSSHAREVERAQGDLLRTAAHDLRNAVAAVEGLAGAITEEHDDFNEDDAAILAAIAESAAEATTISTDLMSLAQSQRASTVRTSDFDLADLVATIVAGYDGIEFYAPAKLGVSSDPQRIGQVVRNLVTNAIRHGGEQVVVTLLTEGGAALVRVADNGDGVPGDASELFTPQVSSHSEGLGIGLATAHDLALRVGARLTYERTAGWSVFSLAVPLEREPAR